jgi:hypothetical protein
MINRGYITIAVLVFAGVFGMIISGLTGFIFTQTKLQVTKDNRERAIQIAEAGLDYYRWFLAHFPDDLQNGTGEPGPYQVAYNDPEAGQIGTYEINIAGNESCGELMSIDIESTGWTEEKPTIKRTVVGTYARPSIAEYAYIINSNVWAGADRNIFGPYHSNGGIRMDGTNQSTVSSAVESWICTSSFGCSSDESVDGIFGEGTGSALWKYPTSQVDFNGITLDLNTMKAKAQELGVYLNPQGGASQRSGYHLIFLPDGTVDVYRVTSTSYTFGIHTDESGWQKDYYKIENENFIQNYTIPVDCGLIFAEARLWVEGEVNNKVTVVAARPGQANIDNDVIIEGDITYSAYDGSNGITVVAEGSILIPPDSSDTLTLNGIFLAQKGYFGRNYYSNNTKSLLSMTGSIISNGRVGTKWSCSGSFCSGYETRVNSYDRDLATSPPPLTPYVSNEYQFIEWLEKN